MQIDLLIPARMTNRELITQRERERERSALQWICRTSNPQSKNQRKRIKRNEYLDLARELRKGTSGPVSDSNEGVFRTPRRSSITWASPSDCFMSYLGHTCVRSSYSSAKMQSVYSKAPGDWAIIYFNYVALLAQKSVNEDEQSVKQIILS